MSNNSAVAFQTAPHFQFIVTSHSSMNASYPDEQEPTANVFLHINTDPLLCWLVSSSSSSQVDSSGHRSCQQSADSCSRPSAVIFSLAGFRSEMRGGCFSAWCQIAISGLPRDRTLVEDRWICFHCPHWVNTDHQWVISSTFHPDKQKHIFSTPHTYSKI